ncbi:MAG: chemotaxis protein CheW [Planctomycetia bacterium]|nr:chemotaxis protein CheW [Planctomycetia bacterium]
MIPAGASLDGRVAEMRREFDASFARPPAPEPPPSEPLLRFTAGGTRFFARLRDLSGVLPCAVVVPVPGARRGLLGLTVVRGQILPLYALATLLELPGSAPAPRWILVPAGGAGAGLGVDFVEGASRILESAVLEVSSAARRDGGKRGLLQEAAGSRALLDVASVVASLRNSKQPSQQEG